MKKYFEKTTLYEGNWLDGKKHGFGTSYGQDGSKYVGHWEEHKKHGSGKFYYKNGCYFETTLKNGQTMIGSLKFFDDSNRKFPDNWNEKGFQVITNSEKEESVFWLDGSCFIGKVDETGLKVGHGTFYSSEQQVFTGNWNENCLSGENCVIQNPVGRIVFVGKIENDQKVHGKLFSLDSQETVYEGEFKKNRYSGSGKLFRQDGSVSYDGQFKNGLKNGDGVSYYLDGGKFVGEWKDGKRHGKGKEFWVDGKMLTGVWRRGKTDYEGEETDKFQVFEHEDGIVLYTGAWPCVDNKKSENKVYGAMDSESGDKKTVQNTFIDNETKTGHRTTAAANTSEKSSSCVLQ
jgi:antitoxin component YwqK of YwqJK toxin-antitoxin module